MNRLIAIIILCMLAYSSMGQPKIIFSNSKGALNSGETLNLMAYDFNTKSIQMLIKGSVKKRGEYNPSTSPDNSRITFNTYRFGGWKLAIADLNNDQVVNIKRLTNRANYEYNAKWSHGGTQIVYQEYSWGSNNTELFISDVDDKKVAQLTQLGGSSRNPDWTKDDKQIVFTSDGTGNDDIFIMSVDGTEINNLTNHPSNDFASSVSPKEGKVAFLSDREGQVNLYIMNVDKSNLTNLTKGFKSQNTKVKRFDRNTAWAYKTCWSPDGSMIVFSAFIGGDFEIFVINKDGTNLTQITDNDDTDITPYWTN